ncbi:MAG: hypothetical protein Fur0024_0880 [Patescibacteria group bacterium]
MDEEKFLISLTKVFTKTQINLTKNNKIDPRTISFLETKSKNLKISTLFKQIITITANLFLQSYK